MVKKLLAIIALFLLPLVAFASILGTQQGGTGSSSPSGILFGNNNATPLSTLTIGSNLTLTGSTLSATGGGGSSTFGTTSLSAVAPLQYSQSPLAQFSITQAGVSTNGYLSSTDWNTFNNKQPAGTYVTAVSGTANQITSSGGTTPTLSLPNHVIFPIDYVASAGSTTNATSTNFAITGGASNCNGTSALTTNSSGVVGCTAQPQGTVTAVSVASSNGFAGTSSGGATPALTLTTTITGLLKGNGTAISAAANGTDYTLLTANTCGAGQFFNSATAAGVLGCGTPAGTTYTGTFPIAVTGSVISFGGLSTSSPLVSGQPTYATGVNTIASVASSTFLTSIGGQASGNYLTALTGDGTASGPGSSAFTLATVNSNIGTFNNITINAKGLATAGSNVAYDTFSWPFTPTSYGNATSSTLGFTLGFLSVGSSTIVGNATTTGMHAFGSVRIPTLGVAAGTFLAVDPNGVVIATTTPSGSNSAFSPSANYATATALPSNTYLAGVITAVANGALSVDGANPSVGQRVLVKNESTAANNGLYDVTAAGSAIAAFVLTRDAQYNSSSNIIPGIITYVISGSTNDDDFWAMTSAAPITVGTTAFNYTEVSGGGAAVTSVSNSDSTLTISPTAGAVVASLNLGHANTWSVLQNFTNATSTLFSATYASTTNFFTSSITNTAVKSALVLNSAAGLEGTYGGAAGCTNQVVTAFSAVGATTCTTLAGAMFGSVAANTVFGNFTGASAVPTFTATSSLFEGITGQHAYFASSGGLIGTSSLFTTTNSFTGVGSTTPWSMFSVVAGGAITVGEFKVATTTSITINWTQGNQQLVQLGTAATTITFSNFIAGQHLLLNVCNPNAAAGAVTWGTQIIWAGAGAAPTQTTTSGACDLWSFDATQATSTSGTGGTGPGVARIFGAATLNF